MYLNTAEEKQLQHFNPPAMTPEVFEKYLPYAIAFDVEEVWGERFQQLISRVLVDPNYHPGWYNGSISKLPVVLRAHEQVVQQQCQLIQHAAQRKRWFRWGRVLCGGGGGGGGGGGW